MSYSGSGDATTLVQAVDIMYPPGPNADDSTSGCEASDFAGFTPGNIALIQRGTCYFSTKALNAQAAGAVGVIIFNEGQPGRTDVIFGTLGGPGVTIPVVGATFALGEELYNLSLTGPVTVHLSVDAITEDRTSQNVIGTLEGLEPDQGIVYIGGHYDSVSAGPGANDDASGVAGVLEAARVLGTKGHRTKATLKFLAFGSEEIGLDGSYWYVVENYGEVTSKGLGMVNLDMIGVGDTLLLGNVGLSSSELRDYTWDKAEAWGLTWAPFTAGANSDHYYFEVVGVPVVFLHQSPDPYYHTSEDTPDKIDVTKLEENGELATATMYDWAKNPALREKKAAKVKKVHVYKDKVYAGE
jgi:aminopeptidase Y